MTVDHIRYDLLVRDALRGVVRRIVADVAKNGLPGDHHFYISFHTGAPGVRMSPRLRAQYPDEMTIVLQHQFWDLAATETGIEVGLSFSGVAEKLVVPLDAIKGFFDPSVQFGLEFEVGDEKAPAGTGETMAPGVSGHLPAQNESIPPAVVPRIARERASKRSREVDAALPKKDAAATAEPTGPKLATESVKPESGAEVVRLDRFRKK